jgi:hypothetical protein
MATTVSSLFPFPLAAVLLVVAVSVAQVPFARLILLCALLFPTANNGHDLSLVFFATVYERWPFGECDADD